jgi:hypothetical protein
MKNVLFEQKKKMKLWNKQHFVENETEVLQHVLKVQLPKCIKWISRGIFLRAFPYANSGV